jgi:hypothetical protein
VKKKSLRPRLPVVSEQMKAWSAALASEVSEWPEGATRSFFGFTAFYRKDRIFALLPRTRGIQTSNSLAFKFDGPPPRILERLDQDSRVGSTQMQKTRWFTFDLSSDADLREALEWLGLAYEAAAGKKKKSS